MVDRNAQSVWTHIQKWSTSKEKLIIGIDGYAGSGKTTLAQELYKEHSQDIELVHLDDFIQPVEKRIEMMRTFSDPSLAFEYHWYRWDILEELCMSYHEGTKTSFHTSLYNFETNNIETSYTFDVTKKILLIEGIFLFHPKLRISSLLDKKIFLTIPFALADERRIQREKEKWGEHYQDETHPDNWTRYFITAYKRYYATHHPEQCSDLR